MGVARATLRRGARARQGDRGAAAPGQGDRHGGIAGAPRPGRRTRKLKLDPYLTLDCLDASSDVRNLKKIHTTADKFGKLFARACGMPAATLCENLERIHPEVLRKARVRADIVVMVLHRLLVGWWLVQELNAGLCIDAYLYIDASPQKRGIELWAASYDFHVHGNETGRRLLPFIQLHREMLDVADKPIVLVHQLWLVAGPTEENLRFFFQDHEGGCV